MSDVGAETRLRSAFDRLVRSERRPWRPAAITESIRIQKEIDEVIEAHGGWPAAFQAGAE